MNQQTEIQLLHFISECETLEALEVLERRCNNIGTTEKLIKAIEIKKRAMTKLEIVDKALKESEEVKNEILFQIENWGVFNDNSFTSKRLADKLREKGSRLIYLGRKDKGKGIISFAAEIY